jgi:hypothetical protein
VRQIHFDQSGVEGGEGGAPRAGGADDRDLFVDD